MDARTLLDMAARIIARQDVDRQLLLFFVNSVRRAILRDKDIAGFYRCLTNAAHAAGVIDLAAHGVKAVKTVEYDNGMSKKALVKLDNYEQARRRYPDFGVTGEPRHYFELGERLHILPVPATGQINLLAELWPADLADSPTSADITTAVLPEAWIYLGAAEYLDYHDEPEKGQYWRQKGMAVVDQYLKELSRQYMEGLDTTLRGYYPNVGRLSDY